MTELYLRFAGSPFRGETDFGAEPTYAAGTRSASREICRRLAKDVVFEALTAKFKALCDELESLEAHIERSEWLVGRRLVEHRDDLKITNKQAAAQLRLIRARYDEVKLMQGGNTVKESSSS